MLMMKLRDDRHGPPRVMASAPSVVQQARLMDAAGTAWHAVKCGNLEMITKLFPNQSNVYAKGPVGENVMHVAMLLNTPSTLAITRYLVKLYGTQLVNCPIQERRQQHDPPGQYEGETALHIAVVNRDFDMVKFLVQHGANIRARAWGTFFRQDGPMYYGEFPLSFAACTGQKDVVAYLRRHGAQVNVDCDVFGNTALHLCVIHSQPDMYDFLVDYCAASDSVRNHQGLTPLVLAAHLGRGDMLQHLYNRRRRAIYSFGKVTSYSLSLREIDTVQDEEENGASGLDGGYVPNALEAVLRKRHLDLLQEPLLTTLLQHKWLTFARAQFIIHFVGYLLLEISQTILIWLHSDPDQWNGPARASQELLGVLLALFMVAIEVQDYINWSRECYHRRLTMTVSREQDPPLYPIPGEMRDLRDGRQSLFQRLSARIGFAAAHSGSQYSLPSGLGGRSEGGYSSPTAASTPRNVSHPGTAAGGAAPRGRLAAATGTPQAASGAKAGTATPAAAVVGQVQRVQLEDTPTSKLQPELQQQTKGRQDSSAAPAAAVLSAADARGSNQTAAAAAAADGDAGEGGGELDSVAELGVSPAVKPLSPTRSSQQLYRKFHDDPIDLRPRTGDIMLKEGRSPHGVGVVDTGFTTGGSILPTSSNASAYATQTAGDSAADNVSLSTSSRNVNLASSSRNLAGRTAGPGPVGEGLEDDVVSGQLQPQSSGAEAAGLSGPVSGVAFSRLQRGSGTGESASITSSRQEDDDDLGFDVVSVGLRSSRIRSHINMATDTSGSNALAGAAASGGAASSDSTAAAAGGLNAARDRSVTFSEHANVMGRAASGRVSGADSSGLQSAADRVVVGATGSPRVPSSSIVQQQQQLSLQQPQRSLSPFQQPQLASAASGQADGMLLPAAGSGGSRVPETRSTSLQPPAPETAGGAQAGVSSSSNVAAGVPGAASVPSGALSFHGSPGIPRARSFHGINSGLSGISSLGSSGGITMDGLGVMSRAQTAGDELLTLHMPASQNLAASSTPADPYAAVQMLERQRTRARSGGGDLPAAIALKRTPASSKQKASNLQAGTRPAVSGDGASDGAGPGGAKDGSVAGTDAASMKGDLEKGAAADHHKDPHKSRLRALLETTYEGAVRMVEDPWLFIWHLHLVLTCMHFLTWVSSYGWIGGRGPESVAVREFDDVIVSMMGLSGWLAVIYFFRGLEPTGKLAVVLERCIVDVLKFVSLYILWNLGFTLAFYTMQNGVLGVAPDETVTRNTMGLVDLSASEPDPFSSIGNTMITLINLGTGLSYYEYGMTCKNGYVLSVVLCTMYYLLYMATVVLLLMNLLIAMILHTWQTTQGPAELYWKHRWAIYVIKAERRLPAKWVQRMRLGQPTWDPVSMKPVYSHVFETVDEDKVGDSSKSATESQIKAVEVLLEDLKKRRGSSS